MTSPSNTTSVGNGPDNDTKPRSQQATGGSGGDQLTQSNAENKDASRSDQPIAAPAGNRQAGGPASDATASNRTAQDTRSDQAGSTGTGLGAAETGGNQEFDLPKE
ncbi:MAG: hypothetical protein JWP59_1309 [Massilia sp.]|nr:hypothetical protein [Massilia sp.]